MRTSCALLLLAGLALAQDIELGGKLGAEFGVAVNGDIVVSAASLDLTASSEVGLGFFPDASFEATIASSYDAATGEARLELGEAFAKLFLGDFDLSVGNQTVAWGSADGFNPVDVVNPQDLSFPFGAEKLPVPLLRAVYNAPSDIKVDAVIIPAFRASRLPDARYQPAQSFQPPPGVTIVGQEAPIENLPGVALGNVQYGVRTTFGLDLLDGADISLSYFGGYRTDPTVSVKLIPAAQPGQFTVQPVFDYDWIHLVGVDFSASVAGSVVRGEAAYTFTRDPVGSDPAVGNPSFEAVLGAEYTFGEVFTSLQGILEVIGGDQGQGNDISVRTALSARYDIDNRTGVEGLWLQSLTDGSGVVGPGLSYTFADGVTGEARAFVFYGGRDSDLGAFRELSQLRISLSYAF